MCFIAHPRTASVATGQALLDLGFEKMMGHHQFSVKVLNPRWTVFATVRNPFDLMVSWYYHKKKYQAHTFQEWLPKFLAESNQYLDQGLFFGLPHCTRVLRYEILQEDFNLVLVEAGFPPVEIPHKNVSIARPYKPLSEYYNHKLINLMKAHFGEEIRQNGYGVPRCQAS
jgi:hypothetical protein